MSKSVYYGRDEKYDEDCTLDSMTRNHIQNVLTKTNWKIHGKVGAEQFWASMRTRLEVNEQIGHQVIKEPAKINELLKKFSCNGLETLRVAA